LYVLINSIKYGINLFCTKKYGPGGIGNTCVGAPDFRVQIAKGKGGKKIQSGPNPLDLI
jgi:hypothetical protein